ncbi:type VI protein secretion system component VasF [Bradyrhizobium japonicum]
MRSIKGGVEPVGARARQRGMNRTEPSAEEQIEAFIASAAKQPLLDAAFELWRWRYRLDSIEGRPTAEQVRINRTLTPQQMAKK